MDLAGTVDDDRPDSLGQVGDTGACHQDEARARGVQHVADPFGGRIGRDRHVLAAGGEHRVHGDEQFDAAVDQHGDRGIGADTQRYQLPRKGIDA